MSSHVSPAGTEADRVLDQLLFAGFPRVREAESEAGFPLPEEAEVSAPTRNGE